MNKVLKNQFQLRLSGRIYFGILSLSLFGRKCQVDTMRTAKRRNIITASLLQEMSARTVLVRGRNTRYYSWLHLIVFGV